MKFVPCSAAVAMMLSAAACFATPTITYTGATNEVGAQSSGGALEHYADSSTTTGGIGVFSTGNGIAFAESNYYFSTNNFSCMGQDTHMQLIVSDAAGDSSVGFQTTFTVNEQCTMHIDFGILAGYISGTGSNIGFFGQLEDLTAAGELYNYTEGGINTSGTLDIHHLLGTATLYPGHTYRWTSQWSIAAQSTTWIESTICDVYITSP